MTRRFLFFLSLGGYLLFILKPAFCQEFLVPAPIPVPVSQSHVSPLKAGILDTLDLPFFDDFSRTYGYPDPKLWTDVYVYINNDYPVNPVSIGVATFDAINGAGYLNGNSDIPFESDFLTSMPLNLDYPGQNDTWLSFFYQPQGFGDEPEKGDSLVVEFYSPVSNKWRSVWSLEGQPLKPFTHVWVQVNDTSYFHPGFRFRFKNYASLTKNPGYTGYNSNVDHWNVDYVYLDKGRSQNDSSIKDVAMVTNLASILKSYESVPWSHFPDAFRTEIQPTVKITYRNNDIITRNVTRFFEMRNLLSGSAPYTVSGGAVNVEAGDEHTYEFPFSYPFDEDNYDSAIFRLKSYLVTDEDDYKWNDTVVRNQVFTNYYAYDDGTAEAGYGLSGEGSAGASLAYRFRTYKEDTLRAIKMYFNRTSDNSSQAYFYIAVWDNDEITDLPGNLIYSKAGFKPEYPGELNEFYTYDLDTQLVVSDIFYVGWIQTTTTLLNVGFDRNHNNRNNIFYNLGQEWFNTIFNGSLMIRPVLGKKFSKPSSVHDFEIKELQVYPNPASDYVRLELPSQAEDIPVTVSIYDLQGKLIKKVTVMDELIPVHQLMPGMYLLRAEIPGSGTFNAKLLISR
jgi:hypothetical protein